MADPVAVNTMLSWQADEFKARLNTASAAGECRIHLVKSSAGDLGVAAQYSDISSHFATFKGYVDAVLSNPAASGPNAEDGGYRVPIVQADFAYDSGEAGDASDTIRYAVLTVKESTVDYLLLLKRLDSDVVMSADGQEIAITFTNLFRNQPWPE